MPTRTRRRSVRTSLSTRSTKEPKKKVDPREVAARLAGGVFVPGVIGGENYFHSVFLNGQMLTEGCDYSVENDILRLHGALSNLSGSVVAVTWQDKQKVMHKSVHTF